VEPVVAEEDKRASHRALPRLERLRLIKTTRAALPRLRERGGGRVVNFSSGAGIAGIAGDGC
jgi:short-subunit dehydrogenase